MNEPHNKTPKKVQLSIDELRNVPGNENRSDEELQEQSDTLYELSLILYDLFIQEEKRRSLDHNG